MDFEEYIRFLMSQQPFSAGDPYAPEPLYGSPVGGMLPAFDTTDLGDQAKALNITQDFSDIYSDPAVLGGFFGEMPGPSTYESFTPSPGYMLLQNALAKKGTLESLIAEEIMQPDGSAATAMALVNQMIADGTIPEGMVPQYEDEMGNLKYDTSYVKDVATSYQTALLSDPMATGIDPATGLPGVGELADNPLAEWYQRTNTPLPNQQYTGDDLATPEQLQALQTLPAENAQAREAMAKWQEMHDRASRNPAEFLAPPEGMAAPQGVQQASPQAAPRAGLTPQRGGWADDLERITQDPGAAAGRVVDAFSASGLDRNIGNKLENIGNAVGNFFGRADANEAVKDVGGAAKGAGSWFLDEMDTGPVRIANQDAVGVTTTPDYPFSPNYQSPVGEEEKAVEQRQAARQSGRASAASNRNQGSSLMDQMLGRQEFGARQKTWNPSDALKKSMQDEIDAFRKFGQSQADYLAADKARKERDKIAQVLAAQGHTPYNDTMAQRRMMAQYMGFGG